MGEKYDDANGNNFWEENETYNDKSEYLFPAFWDLFDFLPGVNYPIYESKTFNQISDKFEVNFRLLDKECELENIGNFVIMPIYPYHPHEDLKDQLDEEYEDLNNNGSASLPKELIKKLQDTFQSDTFDDTKIKFNMKCQILMIH